MKAKVLLPVIVLIMSGKNALAAGQTQAAVISDTMIFGLFLMLALLFVFVIYGQIQGLKSIFENRKIFDKDSSGSEHRSGLPLILLLAASTDSSLITMSTEMYAVLLSLNAFLLGIIVTLHFITRGMVRKDEEVVQEDLIKQFTSSLTDAVPVEQEGEIMLDHNYDGIRELDNNLPPWWKYGFYVSIVFSVVYLFHYHLLGSGDLQLAEYQKQVTEAEEQIAAYRANQANQVDEENLQELVDAGRLASGKKVYMDNCKICHGEYGEGLVGPNFTDAYWKHGGGIQNIFRTIKVGVPEKGMISWESQLSPAQMHEVASYILTLEGTNPPNQKAPEGKLWVEPIAESDSSIAKAEVSEQLPEGEEK